jgi:hypothetical protein
MQEEPAAPPPYEAPPRATQARGWMFTSFPVTARDCADILLTVPQCTFFVVQQEICPDTNRPHAQGYVLFTTKRRPGFVQNLFLAHWEVRRGNHSQAVAYCTKIPSRAPGAEPISWGEGIPDLLR